MAVKGRVDAAEIALPGAGTSGRASHLEGWTHCDEAHGSKSLPLPFRRLGRPPPDEPAPVCEQPPLCEVAGIAMAVSSVDQYMAGSTLYGCGRVAGVMYTYPASGALLSCTAVAIADVVEVA